MNLYRRIIFEKSPNACRYFFYRNRNISAICSVAGFAHQSVGLMDSQMDRSVNNYLCPLAWLLVLQKEKSERKMRERDGRATECAFHREINWTGLCRTAALSFSHQQSKLRTFQIFVSLLNIFAGSFASTCLVFKCSLNKVIVFCFRFHCHAVRTLCCTLGWLFVMEITATSNNCLKSLNTHTHTPKFTAERLNMYVHLLHVTRTWKTKTNASERMSRFTVITNCV